MVFRRKILSVSLLWCCWFGASANTKADTLSNWNGGSGNWSDVGQWTPALVPNNTSKQSFDVTIGSGAAALDVSPVINTLTVNGDLAQGFDASNGSYTTLTVNGNATVNGSIGANANVGGWRDSLFVGGNLINNGGIGVAGQLSVNGNVDNNGNLLVNAYGPYGLGVNGTLRNSGSLQLGSDNDFAGYASVARLVSTGSVNVGPLARLVVGSARVDIPKMLPGWFSVKLTDPYLR